MQAGHGVIHGVVMGPASLVGDSRQREITDHPAFDMLHNIEHLTDDALVLAEHIGFGRRNIGLGERRDRLVFAVDRVGGGQQIARRLFRIT